MCASEVEFSIADKKYIVTAIAFNEFREAWKRFQPNQPFTSKPARTLRLLIEKGSVQRVHREDLPHLELIVGKACLLRVRKIEKIGWDFFVFDDADTQKVIRIARHYK